MLTLYILSMCDLLWSKRWGPADTFRFGFFHGVSKSKEMAGVAGWDSEQSEDKRNQIHTEDLREEHRS